jgi:hypothetical protein
VNACLAIVLRGERRAGASTPRRSGPGRMHLIEWATFRRFQSSPPTAPDAKRPGSRNPPQAGSAATAAPSSTKRSCPPPCAIELQLLHRGEVVIQASSDPDTSCCRRNAYPVNRPTLSRVLAAQQSARKRIVRNHRRRQNCRQNGRYSSSMPRAIRLYIGCETVKYGWYPRFSQIHRISAHLPRRVVRERRGSEPCPRFTSSFHRRQRLLNGRGVVGHDAGSRGRRNPFAKPLEAGVDGFEHGGTRDKPFLVGSRHPSSRGPS